MAARHARQTQGGTPGRRANVTSNQYFDVGRVGRKTGVTLKDTGIRDDYGLEPLSDIFSTPGSAGRSTYIEEEAEDDGSAEMEGLDSPGQDVDDLITQRRVTEEYTPPRQTVKAIRSSISRPGTNQSIRFDDDVRHSIEKQSPFKPKHVLRRSNIGGVRPEQRRSAKGPAYLSSSPGVGPSKRKSLQHNIYEPEYNLVDEEHDQEEDTLRYSTRDELEGALDHAEALVHSSPITPRKRRQTLPQQSSGTGALKRSQPSPQVPATNKRLRLSEDEVDITHASAVAPSSRRLEKAPVYDVPAEVQPQDEGPLFLNDYNEPHEFNDNDDAEGSVDLPEGDDDDDQEQFSERSASPVSVVALDTGRERKTSRQPGQKRPPKPQKAKPPPRPRRGRRADSEESSDYQSDYDSEASTGKKKRGPTSNMRYRSTTPFEDAAHKTTRSGRAVIKPLDWWAGEAVIWKNGEVDGVIRANSVEPEKRNVHKKRAAHKKRTEKIKNGLGAIDEQDEDLLPDEWEEEVGVYTGEVATWNAALDRGDDEDLVTEDLAFAASSIITRSVAGAAFNYAKIQTLPFFGSGVVEIPPDGVKNTKNSKKMQMNFFVHKGKVEVVITTPTSINPEPARTTVFTITEGGAWIVPRGNNYTIHNSSSTTTAYLFFSQGCEIMEPEATDVG